MGLRKAETLLRDRHRAKAIARCRKNRVRNRGQDWRQRGFAKTGRRVVGFEEMHFDGRRLRHLHQRMFVIVRLLYSSVSQRDFLDHFAQAIDDRALYLCFGGTGIDDMAANVAYNPDLIHLDFFIRCHADFGDFGKVSAMAEMKGDLPPPCARQIKGSWRLEGSNIVEPRGSGSKPRYEDVLCIEILFYFGDPASADRQQEVVFVVIDLPAQQFPV